MDDLTWLMDWYASNCDGDWEHSWGVKIDTLDNPGWSIEIDLQETPLDGRAFTKLEHNLASDVTWWICQVKDRKFRADCGPRDLQVVLKVFRDWVSQAENSN